MKYIPKFQIGNNITYNNIHTNKPFTSEFKKYLKNKEENKKSVILEAMKQKEEYLKNTSEVYKDPETGETRIGGPGLEKTMGPIDLAVGAVGGLYSGGTKLLGSIAELANPLPININVQNMKNTLKYFKTNIKQTLNPAYQKKVKQALKEGNEFSEK